MNYVLKHNDENILLISIVVAAIVLSIDVIYKSGGFSEYIKLAQDENTRLGGQISNVNAIGVSNVIAFSILFYYALYEKKKICFVIMLLPIAVSLTSGSRKAFLSLCFSLMFLLIMKERSSKSAFKYIKIIGVIIIALFALKLLFSLEIAKTITQRSEHLFKLISGEQLDANGSVMIRKKMIEVGMRQFKRTPFFGIGLGNSAYLNYRELKYFAYSHNDYVELLVNEGIFGFLLYYGNVIYLVIKQHMMIKKSNNTKFIISQTIILLYFIANIGQVTYYNDILAYVYYAVALSLLEIEKRRKINENSKLSEASSEGNPTDGLSRDVKLDE